MSGLARRRMLRLAPPIMIRGDPIRCPLLDADFCTTNAAWLVTFEPLDSRVDDAAHSQ